MLIVHEAFPLKKKVMLYFVKDAAEKLREDYIKYEKSNILIQTISRTYQISTITATPDS